MKVMSAWMGFFLLLLVTISGCDGSQIPTPRDIELKESNGTIHAGLGESCGHLYTTVKCAEGLRCTQINNTDKKLCVPKGDVDSDSSIDDRRLDKILEDR